ncbi:MAG TPA: cytochrome C oxidase subunit IV family protein [Pseudolabrys sp.]|nr:cytochrome C oxidase subunit IV family protein [Pseudolabrys sp.]
MSRQTIELWKGPLLIWAALCVLLAITTGSAYIPLGPGNGLINMTVSALKGALIMLLFMNIRTSSVLVRIASAAGLFWLTFMFALTASDYLTR